MKNTWFDEWMSYGYITFITALFASNFDVLQKPKKYYSAVVEGRDDFENLHPAAIGLNLNKQ